jgi:GNAT superfamily N-acetyltransferase
VNWADEATIQQLQRHAAEAFRLFVGLNPALGASVEQVGDATVFRWPSVPIVLFNHAVGLGDDRMPQDEEIDRILAPYREQGLPCYIQLSPLADREGLGRRLADRGLELHPSWSVLSLTRETWRRQEIDPSVAVEPVAEANRDDFVRVLLEAFTMSGPVGDAIAAMIGHPDVLCFLARHDGEPAGTGQLITKAGVGGLFSGGVLQRFRRRGIHTALISARVEAALDSGLQLLYSETEEVGNQSSRDLQRQGFFEAYQHVNWYLAVSYEP